MINFNGNRPNPIPECRAELESYMDALSIYLLCLNPHKEWYYNQIKLANEAKHGNIKTN